MNRDVCEHFTPANLECDKCFIQEIDRLWNVAMHESAAAGEQRTCYRFAKLVAAAVREDNIIKRNAVRDELTMSRVNFIRLREADRALARAAEREKCAKKCESYIATEIGKEMADAIRAMGNE